MTSKLIKKNRLYQVPAPLETLGQMKDEFTRGMQKYGHLFSSTEEFELFWMLPLCDSQREYLIKQMINEKNFQREIEECTGQIGSCSLHRDHCIACCSIDRPAIAEPYYTE